jgi:hypothetical protein
MPARPQHQQTRIRRACGGVVEQGGLSEPSRGLQQHYRPGPAVHLAHQVGDHPEFGVPLEQHRRRHRRRRPP